MKLELHVSMDGSAFDNGPGPLEVTRILREAARRLDEGSWGVEVPLRLFDVNGNRVGYALVTESDDPIE